MVSKKIILRRTKEDVHSTQNLPPCNIKVQEIPFSSIEEQQLYETVYKETQKLMHKLNSQNQKNTIKALELLLRIRQICCHPQCYYTSLANKDKSSEAIQWKFSSTKLECIGEMINKQPSKEKSLIFVHFINEMKAYVEYFKSNNVSVYKIDGSMSIEERVRQVSYYQNDKTGAVFVIQIQTGGVGYNLQCANHVYITSPLWNPALQHQIIGRAHRNGQDKPVNVHIMCIAGEQNQVFIEQYILRLQQQKREIMSEILNDKSIESEGLELLKESAVGLNVTFGDVFKMFQK